MSIEQLLNNLKIAWAAFPFPWLFLLLIPLGFLWLWIEYQSTRVSRKTPGWRRPLPLLPTLSRITAIAMRASWALLWVWLVLFLVVFSSVVASQQSADVPTGLRIAIISGARAWRQGYGALVGAIPDPVGEYLQPSSFKEADGWP